MATIWPQGHQEERMKSNADYYGQYWKKGWVVVEGVFMPEEADCIAKLALTIAQTERGTAKPVYNLDASEDGTQQAPRKIDHPFLKDEKCRKFVLDERLTGIIKLLLSEKPLLFEDQIMMKPPRFGSAKPYHQDNFYFRCHPDNQVITAWIALDEVDAANGCLRYIDGSHLGPILPHTPILGQEHNLVPAAELIDLSKESLAPVRKGGVVFHHSKTLHTSHRNESDRWRRGVATHWATAQVTSEIDTLDQAYFKTKEFAHLFA
jgi:ectoine hydroxylase-related dioxygenase (phytanoyl-CoA dioxygenase family)